MKLLADGRLSYRGPTAAGSACHVRLYADDERTILILGEYRDNPGTDVGSSWPILIDVVRQLLERFSVPDLPVDLYEYHPRYPGEVWDNLAHVHPGRDRPTWQHATAQQLQLHLGRPLVNYQAEEYVCSLHEPITLVACVDRAMPGSRHTNSPRGSVR